VDFALDEATGMFRDAVRKWVEQECPKAWCRELGARSTSIAAAVGQADRAGFHGIGIPEEYGGIGGDIITQAVFMREFARTAAGLAWIWGITAFSGVNAIQLHGSTEQKRRFLPLMARGQLRPRSPSPSRAAAPTCSVA
jgi:alkylation response protein AidB-like acyl-CoA dehydrogenase